MPWVVVAYTVPLASTARDPLLAPVRGAESREVGGARIDVARAGAGRVKRVVYPPGFRWSTHMKAVAGTVYLRLRR